MAKYSVLATISLMFNVIAFTFLLMKIHISKNTSTYNWSYLVGNVIAQVLLIIYGFLNNAPEVYGPTILLLFGLLYIVFVKATYNNDDETNL